SAENQVERTLGHGNGVERLSRGVIYKDLGGGKVDVALAVLSEALAALCREWANGRQGAVRYKSASRIRWSRRTAFLAWLSPGRTLAGCRRACIQSREAPAQTLPRSE